MKCTLSWRHYKCIYSIKFYLILSSKLKPFNLQFKSIDNHFEFAFVKKKTTKKHPNVLENTFCDELKNSFRKAMKVS